MVLGTQWYILFNVIAGASVIPTDLREAAAIFGVRRWQWWRSVVLPAIFPYYVTGALTASGGSWNASIVAEVGLLGQPPSRGRRARLLHRQRHRRRRLPRVALGIAVMSVFVIVFNRLRLAADVRLCRTPPASRLILAGRSAHGHCSPPPYPPARSSRSAASATVTAGSGAGRPGARQRRPDAATRMRSSGLLGRSGSGKSTLLRSIAGLIRPARARCV